MDWARYVPNPATRRPTSALEARFHKLRAQYLEAYAAYEKHLIAKMSDRRKWFP